MEAGFYRLIQPTHLGGGGLGPLKHVVALETISASSTLDSSCIISPDPGVLSTCNGELRERYLMPMLSGVKRSAFAYTESKIKGITEAVVKGDNLVINGFKAYISGGDLADFILVSAQLKKNKTDTTKKPVIMIVDIDADGVKIQKTFESIEGSSHTEVEFTDFTIPLRNLITETRQGVSNATAHILRERMCQAAIAIGMAMNASRVIEQHLGNTYINGRRKSDLEGIRLKHSDIHIKSYAARSVLYRTAKLYEEDQEIINEVNMAKVFCTEAAYEVIDSAMQLTGGSALILGHPIELLYRKARAMKISGGFSDVLRMGISRGVFEFDSGTI